VGQFTYEIEALMDLRVRANATS